MQRRKVRRRKLNWKLHGAKVERQKRLNGDAEGWTGNWIGRRRLRAERWAVAWLAGAWLAVAWLRLKCWRRRLRLKGCVARRLMLKGWLRRRARLRVRGGRHRAVPSERLRRGEL